MTTRNRELASIVDASGNLTTGGNLTVSGTTTTVSSTVETHADPLIELNTGAGSNSNDLGFVFERGSTGDNACLIWDESNDVFAVGTTTATGTSTGNMSFSVAGFTAGVGTFSSLDISGDADIDGTLEADAITVNGATLAETISDTVGAMVGSNTESGITVAYQDSDNTLDFTVGTLNQNTTGTAATVTTAAQPNITSLGTLTTLTVDNITINGNDISSTNSDGDILFKGNDGGSTITALTLDMSDSGAAIFNQDIYLVDNSVLRLGTGQDFRLYHDGSHSYIHSTLSDADIVIKGNDGGSTINALTLDMSAAGAATFTGNVKSPRFILDAPTSGGTRYLFTDNTNTGDGRLAIQSGGGSAGYGGGLSLFSHSHASKPGWVTAGLSLDAGTTDASSEARFTVNTQGLAGGTDIFSVLRSGKVGIGTTTPGYPLEIVDSSANAPGTTLKVYSNQNSAAADGLVYIHADNDVAPFTTLNVVQDGTGLGSDVNCTKATDNRTVAIFEGQGIGSSQAAGGQYVSITRTGPISNAAANVCGGLLLANGSSVTAANCGIRGTYEYNSGRDIQFFTSSDNSSAPTNKMLLKGDGRVWIRNTTANYDGGQFQMTSAGDLTSMYVSNTGFASHGQMVAVERGATSSYSFAQFYSGRRPDNGGGDREFNFRGDGNAYADASWNASGADYAEYFEWADGNTDNNDRVGHSVSLVNNKIKIAESGETVIGIISGNPSVVGDTSWNKWQGKHMRDDYGRYIWEEYTEEDGKTVDDKGNKLTRRKLNPDYNSETAYINRENRKEWDAVGLMGKLRMKKGQQTGTNWIKMRDISASVEEWLVR